MIPTQELVLPQDILNWAERQHLAQTFAFIADHGPWMKPWSQLWLQLRNTPQDAGRHPEGNVRDHTLYVVKAALRLANENMRTADNSLGLTEEEQRILIMAAFLHDFGKYNTTQTWENGCVTSRGHDDSGADLIKEHIKSAYSPALEMLVRTHHAHLNCHTNRAARRLEVKLHSVGVRMGLAILLCEADHSGRPPHPPSSPLALRLLTMKYQQNWP